MKKKKILEVKKIDYERETRVLLESMHSDIKRIAEGHSGIMRKLEEHDRRFDSHDRRFDSHDRRFDSMESESNFVKLAVMDTNQRVKSIGEKLDNHETRITKLEEKVHT